MRNVYRPGESPEPGAPPPAGLALGDTRFWHAEQTLLQALVEHPRVAPEHAAIRHALNLESVITYEGTETVHQLVIGRELTGINAF